MRMLCMSVCIVLWLRVWLTFMIPLLKMLVLHGMFYLFRSIVFLRYDRLTNANIIFSLWSCCSSTITINNNNNNENRRPPNFSSITDRSIERPWIFTSKEKSLWAPLISCNSSILNNFYYPVTSTSAVCLWFIRVCVSIDRLPYQSKYFRAWIHLFSFDTMNDVHYS